MGMNDPDAVNRREIRVRKRVMNEGFSCAFHLISFPPFVAGLGIAIALVMTAIGYILSIASKGTIERKRLEMMGSDQKK